MSDFDLRVDVSSFQRELQRMEREQPIRARQAIAEAGQWLFTVSKNWLTRLVYQKEIPKRPGSSKNAWRRTYELRNAERISVATAPDGSQFQIFTDPGSRAARYAQARHDLNRPSRVDGRTRLAPWRTKAREEGMTGAAERIRRHLARR